MIFSYFISFCKNSKVKILIIVLSISIYFALSVVLATLNDTLPKVASLPFQKIGVGIVVQKTGKIPSHMTGAIFPHSNGPIYENEVSKLSNLDFVQTQDSGLYFWYFGDKYFKTVLGVKSNSSTFSRILKLNIEKGDYDISSHKALITASFANKNHILLEEKINIGNKPFTVAGILTPNLTGNIIPADVYINLDDAQNIVIHSDEMQSIYKFKNQQFVNVVAFGTNPKWQGDKEAVIKKIDKDYIIFSEKTFSKEALEQIKLVSSLGKIMFLVLGMILLIVFSLLVFYNFKTREKEIAVLRMIGWSFTDLQKQFIGEGIILVVIALVLGNLLAVVSLLILKQQTISLELPWEISAKPHFLPQENAINRTISANLPIQFNLWIFVWFSLAFLIIFTIVNYIAFQRLKNIKPAKFLK